MASECSQEAVLRFLTESGGRARNADLIEHFRPAIPTEPGRRAAAREAFKRCVDSVAVVKVDGGEKYVCLKKKFRGGLGGGDRDGRRPDAAGGTGQETGAVPSKRSEDGDAKQETAPGFGRGTAGKTSPPGRESPGAEMGNQATTRSESHQRARKLEDIPETTAPAEDRTGGATSERDSVSPGLEKRSGRTVSEGMEGRLDQTVQKDPNKPDPQEGHAVEGTSAPADEEGLPDPAAESESDQKASHWLRRRQPGSQCADQSADDGPGAEANTPKGSRKNFLEHMMSSSPQVRRSMVLRSSVHLSARCKDSVRADGDAVSLHSSSGTVYDENAPVALEPLEHEWMMCASDGEWESLRRLLAAEPGLVCKKDFVTGFTCLHWAAKLGKAELLALLVSSATQRGVPVDVNARSSAGYTPLHLAAMHNHMEVVKLLVGAYDADVEVRDYSGKKASQYLKGEVAQDVLDIVGAGSDSAVQVTDGGEASGWRLSRVFQANLRPLRLLNHSASEDDVSAVGESAGLAKDKVLRRKTSLRGLRPRLSKIRTRAQIVHSTSLSGHFETEAVEPTGAFRSRPKSNLFG